VSELSAELLAAAGAAAFILGFLKASVGGGIGLTLTPTLSLVLPAQTVLGLLAILLNLANPITLRYYWRSWDGRQLRLLLPSALAGIVLGSALIAGLSDHGLKRAIGAAALAFASLQLATLRGWLPLGRISRSATGGRAVGVLVGIASAVAHSGGVILGPYLAGLGLGNAAVVGTGTALVVASDILKLGAYWGIGFLGWPILWASLAATPLLYLGIWLGYRLNRWIPRQAFALVLIAIAILGALRLLAG
jgi:uncharacterized protein